MYDIVLCLIECFVMDLYIISINVMKCETFITFKQQLKVFHLAIGRYIAKISLEEQFYAFTSILFYPK